MLYNYISSEKFEKELKMSIFDYKFLTKAYKKILVKFVLLNEYPLDNIMMNLIKIIYCMNCVDVVKCVINILNNLNDEQNVLVYLSPLI